MRQLVMFEDHFKEFRKTLIRDDLKKVYQVLTLIMSIKVVPATFPKSITGKKGLYEILIEHENKEFRVFCCFDEGNLLVLLNGFQKKTQKTPVNQLDKAETLMKRYFEQKKELNNGQ